MGMIFVSITEEYPVETLKIIEWYRSNFSYHRITTKSKAPHWGNTYHELCNKDIDSISVNCINKSLTSNDIHRLRFLFVTIEDKTLFDLTWG
jgi:hypothetical protein